MNRSGERSMLNMFMSAMGWVDGADPFTCPGLKPYIRLIENCTWSGSARGSKNSADLELAAKSYFSAETEAYSLVKNEFSATELNAAALIKTDEGILLPELAPGVETILSENKFETDFGTLCHRLIEWIIKNNCWKELPSVTAHAEELRPFFRNFTDTQWPLLIDAAKDLASGFFGTDLWRSAAGSERFESELAFTACREEEGGIFVNGIIDLVFVTEDSVQIIDFKTDRRIIPGEYDKQMSIYIDAAEGIFSKPASCSLFYLRSGDEVKLKR
jgi:ATP-dependent exoDNAse (exonuclease V) beta subunit